jgi:hypothetical protein
MEAKQIPLIERFASVPADARPEQESFSNEAISATQAAWKMGYDAAKAEQPEQEPVAWEDVLGAIARGWTHDDNKHKTMDVQLAVAIAKEIQDMVIAPPQRKPLTKEEMFEAIRPLYYSEKDARGAVDISEDEYRAIEAAHGIKENT